MSLTDAERLMAKVEMVESGCWEWRAAMYRDGYGAFCMNGRQIRAHRASHELFIGPIPAGLLVLHSCDNAACVNPEHLRAGTHAENMRDMVERKRYRVRSGERHRDAKLTERDVRDIRTSALPNCLLAEEYGVSRPVISRIRSRKIWKEVP